MGPGLSIIREKCTGCRKCERACPFDQMRVMNAAAVVGDGCTLCGACYEVCEFGAIVLERHATQSRSNLEGHRGVFVFAEHEEGVLRQCVLELLGEGRRLADEVGQELAAVLLCGDPDGLCSLLFSHGADKVYLARDPSLSSYQTEIYTAILAGVVAEYKPSIFLFSATTTGRDLAPRLAARVGTGLTADCTALDIEKDSGLLLQIRPAWGGNLMACIKTPNHRPQMATVRAKIPKKGKEALERNGEVIPIPVVIHPEGTRVRVLDFLKGSDGSVNLEEADVVVCGGRGMQSPANFGLIEELARLLGAAVGATRPVVDCGWKPHSYQIGQTGKTVQPRIYIACGVSGSLQHRVGMEKSDTIVAINKDPTAPIMQIADYPIAGDLFKVLPPLIEEIKSRKRAKVLE
jgi:electron transfer flavoprotein alpha subunit